MDNGITKKDGHAVWASGHKEPGEGRTGGRDSAGAIRVRDEIFLTGEDRNSSWRRLLSAMRQKFLISLMSCGVFMVGIP
jgi:hypothetical protein